MFVKLDQIQFNPNEPIYLQIVKLIKRAIASGELAPGDKLPSVREMSQKLSVNPNTLQRAYTELERQEVTETKRGLGSFVSHSHHDVSKLKETLARDIMKKSIEDLKTIGLTHEEMKQLMNELLSS